MEHFWKWDKALPKTVCEDILSEAIESKQFELGLVNDGDTYAVKDEVRNNYKCFLKQNHYLEGILYNHALYANKQAGWNLDADVRFQVQIARYMPGEFYDWHSDDPVITDKELVRKISVVLQLNDPKEYEGGGLYIEGFGEYNFAQEQGDIICFPSVMLHKAAAPTKGTRYSAALWVAGPKYK